MSGALDQMPLSVGERNILVGVLEGTRKCLEWLAHAANLEQRPLIMEVELATSIPSLEMID